MSTSQYLLGTGELVVIAAALGLGAVHVRELLVPGWLGAMARLAEFVLAISALVVIAEVLGFFKLLDEVPLVLASVAVGLGAAYLARRREKPHGVKPEVSPIHLMTAIAVAAAALVVAHWAQPAQQSMDIGMYFQDTTWYHMSFSARFDQTGEVGPLHFTDPLKLAAWFYPQNSELLNSIGIVALDNDFLSTLINLGWLALSLLAAWCIGRPYAIGAATVLGAAVVLDSEMLVASQAGNAPNDIAGLFFLLATLAFLVNGAATSGARLASAPVSEGPGVAPMERAVEARAEAPPAPPSPGLAGIGTGPLFLGGLAAGLGIGTKITLLAALGVLTIGLAVLGGRRGWLHTLGVWLGGMTITAGFWYGRNLVHAANPFPQVGKLGPIDLPGPEQVHLYPREPHKLSEYYNDPHVWQDVFFPVLHDRLGPLWPVILAFVAFGLMAALVWGGSRVIRLLAITGIVAGIAYVFTPLTASGELGDARGFDANLRYVAPSLVIAFTLVPLIPRLRHGPWPWVLIGFFAILVAQGTITEASWSDKHLKESLQLAAIVVAVPAVLVALSRFGTHRGILVAFALAALVVTVALGRTQEEQYLDHRYSASVAPPLTGGFRASPEWVPLQKFGRNTTDARIAVVGRAGAFGQYFFYGTDLSNWVQYPGRHLRRGTFRPIDTCYGWRTQINEGDYDYIVTTPRLNQLETTPPPENAWTGRDKNAEVIVRSGPARIFKVNGPLDPTTCPELGEAAHA
ncbi:MAG: hypothetical protein ACRDK5_06860 [Solirubrobacterales bacterium]